ncbi:hypothetical protein DY000_02000082 [Brassica cretica]|uniref:Uncharacterized protein n=1 Tax=Brassica cretica TaxID=69181 RepID=A0ABQ7C9X4_BRACR|nr:hypothetical protein DY000_02000082 [Brassica cretica]
MREVRLCKKEEGSFVGGSECAWLSVLKGLIDFIGKSNHSEGSADQTVDGDGRTDEPPSADRRDCPSNNTYAEDADGRINEVLRVLNEVLRDLAHVITL